MSSAAHFLFSSFNARLCCQELELMTTQGFVFSMPQAFSGLTLSTAQLCEQKGRQLSPNLKSREYPESTLGAKSLSTLSECWMLGSEHTESSLNLLKYQKASYHNVSFMIPGSLAVGMSMHLFCFGVSEACQLVDTFAGDLIQINESEWIYTTY